MERITDCLLAFLALLLFSPLGLIIMLVLRLTGEGKVFYRQRRVGRGGREFGMIKFVTMLEDSPNLGTGDITLKNDPRVLPVGRLLRASKLNEVPQLLNVLLGDMSLVGPRPLTPKNFAFYPEPVKRAIVSVAPGLTGVGSIVFRDEEGVLARSEKTHEACYREDIAPYKGSLELWYIGHRSFALYLRLLMLTAWAVIYPKSNLHRRLLPGLPPVPAALKVGLGSA